MHTLSKEAFEEFIDNLIADNSLNVVGVKSKGEKFAFGPLESANQLRLDYDVTLLPPKKYFFPQRETLVTFDVASGFQAKDPKESKSNVLVGVHPYDIMALLHMDEVFRETKSDPYYLERRNSSVIIGVNIQNLTEQCFAPSMGCATVDYGYDLMLTNLGEKYAIDVGSHKGADILNKYAKNAKKAFARDIQAVGKKKMEIVNMAQQKFNFSSELIPEMLGKFYEKDSFWKDHSEECLSCGSCVLVCPTCYCFDVKDNPDLSLKKGERTRTWDGCLLEDFAKVASGENFRDTKATRYRHRYFKKGKYLFDRFGFVSCVGCGRCSSNCLPDIANPVNLFNDMYAESLKSGIEIDSVPVPDISIKTGEIIEFAPKIATIVKKVPMTANEIMFELKLDNETDLGHQPGQFVQVSVFGVGEAPFGVSSSPTKKGTFELCIRKLGNVTSKIHTLNEGDKVGIRGPFGKGFDAEFLKGKDLLFVAGGLGIVPLRSLFNYVLANRKDYGRVILLYGCKEPRELLFADEILELEDRDDVEFMSTVDWCPENEVWTSNVGVITTLIPKVDFDPQKTYAVVVGPPIMYKFVIKDLKSRNVPDDHIIVSLERRMKCGVGKCGHCQINQLYVCKDGPVFYYSDIKGVPEAL
ncbi:MAG: 4Fe-4S dicluster domain-containing protein [Candidatus Bathyarchaeota archaeon]|jgi:NAD(P)H-flavin reductase|nr:4Fe-4S dicluster domain-containing protein [Candidatus Bathyarchaeota archaeon]